MRRLLERCLMIAVIAFVAGLISYGCYLWACFALGLPL